MSRVIYAKTITIFELNDDELSKLLGAIRKNKMDNDFAKAVEAEHTFRSDGARHIDGSYPLDESSFEWFDSIACGSCPTCGRKGKLNLREIGWPDSDREIEVICPMKHKNAIYRSRVTGSWE